MGKGSNTTTTTSSPPPQVLAEYQQIMDRANQVASTPYQQYGGQLLAPFSADQQSAFQTVENAQGIAQPYFNTATNYATMGAAPISAAQIQNYSNPYQNQVVNATLGQLNLLNSQQQNQLTSGVAGSGGLFNDRYGVAQAQLAGQQATNEAPTIAGLNASNYTQALNAAQADRSAYQNAAYTFGNLGNANLNAILTGAQAELGTGAQQQQQAQQGLNIPYGQWLQQQAFPYQQTGWLAGVETGVGSNMGGTSSTTGPAPNMTAPYLGAGLGLLSFLHRGGGINRPHYDDGGGVPMFPYGASGAPFSGATSYIPGVQITHGSGPPRPPGAPSTQSPTDALKSMQAFQGLGKSAEKGIGKLFGSSNSDVSLDDVTQAGAQAGLSPSELGLTDIGGETLDLGGLGGFRRGGGIDRPHYDDGGGVEDWPPMPAFDISTPIPSGPGTATGNAGSPVVGFGDEPSPSPAQSMGTMAAAGTPAGISRPSWASQVGASDIAPTNVAQPMQPWPGTVPPSSPASAPSANDNAVISVPARELNAQQAAPVYTGGDRKNPLSYGAGVVSMDRAKNAIGTFESGNNYSEVGPMTKLGRALGRYQVMEKELPGQLRQAGLLPMTPAEFLRDRGAQDKLFETVFGGLMTKYGNFNDAASMWFSGRPVDQAGNRKDVLGTTVPMYLANTNAILAKDVGDQVAASAKPPRSGPVTLGDSNVVPFERREREIAAAPAAEGREEKRSGLLGLNMSPELRQGLLTAGFSMMANRSPFLGVAIGDAGLAGMGAYQGAKTYAAKQNVEERKLDLSERMMNARLQQLDNAAKASAARIDAETKRAAEAQRHNIEAERTRAAAEARRLDVEERGGAGYRWKDPDDHSKGVEAVPGGPKDPAVIAAAAGARKPGATVLPDEAWEHNGDEFLNYIPADKKNLVKAIARYEVDPKALSVVGGHREEAMNWAKQYDPDFDQKTYNMRYNAINRFATGKQGDTARSLNVAIDHLETLNQLGEAMNNNNVPLANRALNYLQTQFGDPRITNFNLAKNIVGDEVLKAVLGSGAGTQADREELQRQFTAASSPAQLKGAIATAQMLMAGQMRGLEQQYHGATGLSDFQERYLSPQTREKLAAGAHTTAAPTGGDILARAREAIAKGASRDAVIQRLRSNGIDPTGL